MFNVNRGIYKFLYDTQGEAWTKPRVLAAIPGAYELIKLAELIKRRS